MTPSDLSKRLERAKSATDFIEAQHELTQDLAAAGPNADSVTAILQFMEANPDLDFGTPGPFVHFVERLPRSEYDPLVVASVSRTPTTHTVWLLNRVLNGTKAAGARNGLIRVLRTVAEDPGANEAARERAKQYLDVQIAQL
ncbi:MAG: hypothetical protein Q8N23_00180 [Archangium sp.]|nr:hypothetical protein [Archangium sp.]MDP3151049.1 hypothetical protein [Archangium sp.]MDP3571733.1 hypothetical protein [Archangium sp.]